MELSNENKIGVKFNTVSKKRQSASWLKKRGQERATGMGAAVLKRKLYQLESSGDTEVNYNYSTARPLKKRPLVAKSLGPLHLVCAWANCEYNDSNYETFSTHCFTHLEDAVPAEEDKYNCQWGNCTYENTDQKIFQCHFSYHPYYTKLRSVGHNFRETFNLPMCTLPPIDTIPEVHTPFQCLWDSCDFIFYRIQSFFNHVLCHLIGKVNTVIKDSKEVVPCSWLGCGKTYLNIQVLKNHARSHTQEKRAACPQCFRVYYCNLKLHDHCKHFDTSDEAKFQCSQCLKIFPSERLLRDHVRLHVNHLKCHLCDMTCFNATNLSKHIRYRHLEERNFKCEFCSHRTVTKKDLNIHLRTHNPEKLFQCDECDYKCRSMLGLDGHFNREHKPEGVDHLLYCCHCCTKQFVRGFELTKHLMKDHDYQWPSGHSRFRYILESDGFYRLKTIRYESIEVTQEIMKGPQQQMSQSENRYNLRRKKIVADHQSTPCIVDNAGNNVVTDEEFTKNLIPTDNNVVITIYDIDATGNTVKSETVETNQLLYSAQN